MLALRNLLIPALCVLALACGADQPQAPGSWGSEGTNTLVAASVAPGTRTVDICNPLDVAAIANITTQKIDQRLPDNTLFLQGYDFAFVALEPGAPQITGGRFLESRPLPVDALPLQMVDVGRKMAFQSATAAQPDIKPSYSARYTFFGVDQYGTGFGLEADAAFRIGRYSTMSVTPSEVSVAAILNPDGDPSDDITFHILCGSGPFSVTSTNRDIIPPPALSAGETSFTVDPEIVSSDTVVKLTVQDSLGAVSLANITVLP